MKKKKKKKVSKHKNEIQNYAHINNKCECVKGWVTILKRCNCKSEERDEKGNVELQLNADGQYN